MTKQYRVQLSVRVDYKLSTVVQVEDDQSIEDIVHDAPDWLRKRDWEFDKADWPSIKIVSQEEIS